MLRTILVGLDGSPFTSAVTALGISWARRFNALLVGVGVIDEPKLRGSHTAPPGGYLEKLQEEWVGTARKEMEQLLQQLAVRCAQEGVSCKLLEDAGTPCDEILKEAQRFDLIMLGKHTHFEAQQGHGRTLHQVLRNAPRPVVAIPEAPVPENGAVLVAYDGGMQAARALQMFALSGLHALGDVHIVSVGPAEADSVEAARVADRAVQFLSWHGIPASPIPVAQSGSIAPVILEQVSALGAQLIVIGAYGGWQLKEYLLGSVVQQVLQESPVPVFSYH
jgi:nucleotide-binding universal stress UspA family protein